MNMTSTISGSMTALDNTVATGNIATIQKIYDAFGRGDVAAILALVTDDVDWDNSAVASNVCPWNANFSGKANLPDFFKAVADDITISVFNPHTFIASENHVAVLLHIESTVTKNGTAIKNDSVHVWTLDDNHLVTKYRHFNDTAQELLAWTK